MRLRNLLIIAGLVSLFAACAPSINPFCQEKDLVFDPRLVGEWAEKGKTEEANRWKFEKADDKIYKLIVKEKEDKEGEFKASLFKLKGELFLDLIPSDCEFAEKQADLVAFAMFPGHLLVRVLQIEPELKIAFFDFDWLDQYLTEHPGALAHHREDKRLLLTAQTEDLQRFVMKHLAEGKLFQETIVYQRKP